MDCVRLTSHYPYVARQKDGETTQETLVFNNTRLYSISVQEMFREPQNHSVPYDLQDAQLTET